VKRKSGVEQTESEVDVSGQVAFGGKASSALLEMNNAAPNRSESSFDDDPNG